MSGRRNEIHFNPLVRLAIARSSRGTPWAPTVPTIIVPDVTALGELANASFPADQTAIVRTVGAWWALSSSSTLPVDGITIVAGKDGRRWVRVATLVGAAALLRTGWYLDYAHGDDEATGLEGDPLKTPAEMVRRYGTRSPNLPAFQSLTLHVLSTQPAGFDPIDFEPTMSGGNFAVIGTPVEVGLPFPAGPIIAKARIPGASPMSVAGFPAGAAGPMLVYNLRRDSYSTIDRMTGSSAALCQPYKGAGLTTIQYPLQGGVGTMIEDDGWAEGDPLQLYQKPSLNVATLQSRRGSTALGVGVVDRTIDWFQFLHVPDATGTVGQGTHCAFGTQSFVYSCCSFEPNVLASSANIALTQMFVNCAMISGGTFRSQQLVGGVTNSKNAAGSFTTFIDGCSVDGDCILHGTCFVKGRYSNVGTALIAPDGTLLADHGAVLILRPMWTPIVGGMCLYGNTLATGPARSVIQKGTASTWGTILKVSTMLLDGAATGSYRSGNTWNDGVPLTTDSLDAHGYLENSATSSRYC